MNSELFLILLLGCIPSYYLWVVYLTRGLHILQFNVAFLALAVAHGVSPILVSLADGIALEGEDYLRFGLYGMAIVVFIACYEVARPARSLGRAAARESTYDGLMGTVGWLFLAIGAGLLYLLNAKLGVGLLYISKPELYSFYRSLGPEKFAKDFVVAGTVVLSYHYCRLRRFPPSFILVILGVIALTAILSARATLSVILGTFVFYYHNFVRPLPNRLVVGGIAILVLLFGTWFEVLALVLPEETYLGGSYSFDVTSVEWWRRHGLIFYLHSWYEIWRDIWGREPQWGLTFVRALAATVWPRFLGGPEVSLTDWYVDQYGLNVVEGEGRAFSLVAEAYMNAGWAGPLILFGVLGVLARKADTVTKKRMVFIRGVWFGSLIYIFMGDSTNILKGPVMFYIVLPVALHWFLGWLRHVALAIRGVASRGTL
jgi:hypothetical protein